MIPQSRSTATQPLRLHRLLVTLLSAHTPRPSLMGSAVAAVRRAGSSTPHPAEGQYATTCYVVRFWQEFSALSFRRKLL